MASPLLFIGVAVLAALALGGKKKPKPAAEVDDGSDATFKPATGGGGGGGGTKPVTEPVDEAPDPGFTKGNCDWLLVRLNASGSINKLVANLGKAPISDAASAIADGTAKAHSLSDPLDGAPGRWDVVASNCADDEKFSKTVRTIAAPAVQCDWSLVRVGLTPPGATILYASLGKHPFNDPSVIPTGAAKAASAIDPLPGIPGRWDVVAKNCTNGATKSVTVKTVT